MIKTLKIATLLLGLITLGAIALVIALSIQPDKKFEDFINAPGQIKQFIALTKAPTKDDSPESPLIKQAEVFTNRIDPPPPPAPPVTKNTRKKLGLPTTPIKAPPPSAKFTLEGTVVASNPMFSMAMLKTTAQGIRWYRTSEKIGHLIIKEIFRDKIIINDGTKTYEMLVPKREKISLLKGDPDNPYKGQIKNPYKSIKTPTNYLPDLTHQSRSTKAAATVKPVPAQPTAQMMKDNIEFLSKFATDPESMGISKEEAEQLGDMGELLGEMEKEMQQLREKEARKQVEETKRARTRRSRD